MADTKLEVGATIQEGIAIGTKNIGPILVNVLLWALTVWIPYINVGTTIGLTAGIVSKASRGEIIPITEIFDPKYRKYMGEFFLVVGLSVMGIFTGMIFGIIPGIVISLAWSLAILLVVDKGKNPTKALILSNNCTYGYKWRMVGIYLLTYLIFIVPLLILSGIGSALDNGNVWIVLSIIIFLVVLLECFVFIGLQASIYRQLTEDV